MVDALVVVICLTVAAAVVVALIAENTLLRIQLRAARRALSEVQQRRKD